MSDTLILMDEINGLKERVTELEEVLLEALGYTEPTGTEEVAVEPNEEGS